MHRKAEPLTPEQKKAFLERDLGAPTRMGTPFVRRGPPSHQRRLILMDVGIRMRISDPQIEWFEDASVRYYIEPKFNTVLNALNNITELRGYLLGRDLSWLTLLSPICENCLHPYREHAREKCLFESSTWRELPVPFAGVHGG